jgi:hypothetical protein
VGCGAKLKGACTHQAGGYGTQSHDWGGGCARGRASRDVERNAAGGWRVLSLQVECEAVLPAGRQVTVPVAQECAETPSAVVGGCEQAPHNLCRCHGQVDSAGVYVEPVVRHQVRGLAHEPQNQQVAEACEAERPPVKEVRQLAVVLRTVPEVVFQICGRDAKQHIDLR